MISEKITSLIKNVLVALSLPDDSISLEYPADLEHGDFSTNIALVYGSISSLWAGNPKKLAERIKTELEKNKLREIEKIEIAGPGFINFYLSKKFFAQSILEISKDKQFGKNNLSSKERVMVEHTDPNPFKEFHIGHLMSNAVGESISRIVEWSGAEVKKVCYQGDVGIHVAKAVWALIKNKEPITDAKMLGRAYAEGSKAYEDPEHKKEIEEINKKIYDRTDEKVNKVYEEGRTLSLKYFEELYKMLGTKFDYKFLSF